jgi:predicted outer membrane repeat protein
MTDFKNPQDVSGSRWERYSPFKRRSLQAVVALLLTSSAAMAAAPVPKIIYVKADAPLNGTGTSWGTAFRYLRDALAKSDPGDTVYITKGVYYPDDSEKNSISPSTSVEGLRDVSFDLNGVAIYGGFVGTETNPGARPPDPSPNSPAAGVGAFVPALADPNRTILSGNINTVEAERSLHVIRMTTNSSLDSVTVEKGFANGRKIISIQDAQGGGCVTNPGTTLTLNNTEFRYNQSYDSGGGIWGTVVATNCRFTSNRVVRQNVYNYEASGGAIKGKVTVSKSTFIDNTVSSKSLDLGSEPTIAEGGAIAGEITTKDCEFESNTATADSGSSDATARGGALSGVVNASRCRFNSNAVVGKGNNYVSYGGAISGQFIVESCAFVSNFTSAANPEKLPNNPTPPDLFFGGGGALCSNKITATNGTTNLNTSEVNNCVFSLNTSLLRGGAIHATRETILKVRNSTFLNNGVSGSFAKGSAICCGGLVTILNNIFWYSAPTASNPQAVVYIQDKFISILGLGGIRTSGSNYPSTATLAKNLMPALVSGENKDARLLISCAEDSGSDVPLGTLSESIIFGDPKFVILPLADVTTLGVFPAKLEGIDKIWGTADDRARLDDSSAAKNVGQILYMARDSQDIDGDGDLTEFTPADMAGFTRVQAGIPDLGAYEYGASVHAPEISITYSGLPTPGELVDNVTPVDLAAFPGVEKTFVIKNLGPANLNRLAITVTGTDIADFLVSQPLTNTVLPLDNTTFTIKFVPKSFGPRTATVSVSSDDADENPFEIKVQGNSIQPEIDIQQPLGTSLVTAISEVDFGAVSDLAETDKTFTILNRGNASLVLSGLRAQGANASDFIVFAPSTANLAANSSTTFKVKFKPAAGGSKTASIIIPSNDVDENPFVILVKGTAPTPDIAVKQADGTDVVDAVSSIDYGRTGYLSTTVKTFTISNSGPGHLTISKITTSGTNVGDFVVSLPVSSFILPNQSTTFTVAYRPSETGQRNAQINIFSDDPDNESTYTFAVTGNSLLTPRIAVKQPFLPDITDGGFSNFGSVQKGLVYTKKFVIRNEGIGVLKGISVNIKGSSTFTKTNPSATILKNGESTTFKVTFKPGSAGIKTAKLEILSNDPTQSPFDITLGGKGTVKKKKKSILAENGLLASTPTLTTGNVSVATGSEGLKYLMLTLAKTGNRHAVASDVEVSSNLLDWYSGASYTTTLVDSETLLKVRDDAPVKAGEKRYIRLKPATH